MNERAKTAYDFSGDAAKVALDVVLAALPVALLYTAIMLVVCTVAIVFMHRRRLYTREAKWWNVLTKLHYPFWLFVFAACGFALGFIASLQSTCDKAIDEKLHPALAGMVLPVQQMIIDSLPPDFDSENMTGQAIYDYLIEKASEDSIFKEVKDEEGMFVELGRRIEKAVRQQITKLALDQAVVAAGEKVGMNEKQAEFSIEVFKSIDFSKKADEIADKVTGAAKSQVGSFANSLRLQVLIYGGILLLLLLIEPLVYYLVVVPRKAKALKAAAATDGHGVVEVEAEEMEGPQQKG